MKVEYNLRTILLALALATMATTAWCQGDAKATIPPPEPKKDAETKPTPPTAPEGDKKEETDKPAATQPKPADAKIQVGDVLAIQVKEDAQFLSRVYQVNNKGIIHFGYVGELGVEGLTAKELTDKLKKKLEDDYLQKASVIVDVNTPIEDRAMGGINPVPQQQPVNLGSIWVMGAINAKGAMGIPNKEFTIGKAIAQAGVAQFAKLSRTKLVRKKADGKTEEIIVNVYDILIKGKIDQDIPVMKDDWIIVPEGWLPGPS